MRVLCGRDVPRLCCALTCSDTVPAEARPGIAGQAAVQINLSRQPRLLGSLLSGSLQQSRDRQASILCERVGDANHSSFNLA